MFLKVIGIISLFQKESWIQLLKLHYYGPVLDYGGQEGRKPVNVDLTVSIKEYNNLSKTLFCTNILTPYQTLSFIISNDC